ncbi:serine/threonine-protein kinase [Deinococcus sonorensis]|uniref:Serine/threonine-protein kinase n=2 Tax=Deinococcus sonorensis TaxID=309891 RepID=A0AAU7UFB7_9DEIO
MPLAGTLVDGLYQLVRPVGRGASSVVYFAVGRDGLPYAVKMFPPELQHHAAREFEHGNLLDHPRLARVLATTTVQGQPSLVLTFARGQVLQLRYQQRPALRFERRAFLLTLVHALDALAHLHALGLVHRDVKPENLIVDADGSAKLVDFDLSGPAFETFDSPVRIGTAAFLSPEAIRGEPLGPRSDLYGIGLLLHWGLYGELPGGDIGPANDPLEGLCRSLLHPDPQHRPASALQTRQLLLELASLPY